MRLDAMETTQRRALDARYISEAESEEIKVEKNVEEDAS
jgi:hypothetical protein